MPNSKQRRRVCDLYFPVLDYGFIALKDFMGGDSRICEVARNSYQLGTKSVSDDRSLIRYMIRNGHKSPFEHMVFEFHIGLPIFVARQLVRHRTARLNEMSGRYSVMPDLRYTPTEGRIQGQSKTNKQGSDGAKSDYASKLLQEMRDNRAQVVGTYDGALEAGVSREVARIDLPLSTFTVWMWQIDASNLMNLLNQRCDEHAQWEIREYADAMAGFLKELAPMTFEAWCDYQYGGASFSRAEMGVLRDVTWISQLEPEGSYLIEGDTHSVHSGSMYNYRGMSKSEIAEFRSKMTNCRGRDFSLDFKKAKTAAFFKKLYEKGSSI